MNTEALECEHSETREDPRHGETYCKQCGLILREGKPLPGPDWRKTPEKTQGIPRTAGKVIYNTPQNNIGSRIEYTPTHSKSYAPRWRWLRYIDQQTSGRSKSVNTIRNLHRAYAHLTLAKSQLKLTMDTITKAMRHYRRLHHRGIRGHTTEHLAIACVLITREQKHQPLNETETASTLNIPAAKLMQEKKYVRRQLNIKTNTIELYKGEIHAYGHKHNYPNHIIAQATHMIEKIIQSGILAGRSRRSIACATLCHIADERPDPEQFGHNGVDSIRATLQILEANINKINENG